MDTAIEEEVSLDERGARTLEAYLEELESGSRFVVGDFILALETYCGLYDGLVRLARDLDLLSERLELRLPRGVSTQRVNKGISKRTKRRCGFRTIYLPWDKYFEAAALLDKYSDGYTGDEGQIRLTRDAGISHLGHLHSGFGCRQGLGWRQINLPLSAYDEACRLLERSPGRYVGNEGQVQLARDAGISHLGHLHSAFGCRDDIRWKRMDLPLSKYDAATGLLKANPTGYAGNEGQIQLARDAGISHLGHLHSAFGCRDDLRWKRMDIPLSKYDAASRLLEVNPNSYAGNEGQVQLARDVGISHLGALFPAFGHREQLGWTYLPLPLSKYEEASRLLEGDAGRYLGNEGQVRLATDAGVSHLGHLYSGFGCRRELGWRRINLPLSKYDEALRLLENNGSRYLGNEGQMRLARDAGISHLGHLYSGFGCRRELGWRRINLPLSKYDEASRLLENNGSGYLGNEGQIRLARDAGISHLSHLYSGFGCRSELEWRKIDLPSSKCDEAYRLLRDSPERYVGGEGLARLARDARIAQLGPLFSAFSHREELGWR